MKTDSKQGERLATLRKESKDVIKEIRSGNLTNEQAANKILAIREEMEAIAASQRRK
jgi:hypothetical protein